VSANFSDSNYDVALAMLSRVIAFFQETPVFTRDSAPGLPADIDKLVVEWVTLDFAQSSHLLTGIGAKYVPFALYRIRRLPFAGESVASAAPAVRSATAGDPPGGRA
jgi:hypothetical protein